jgi:site-specific DNA-methyltransferase (adenine-specific)
MRVFEIRDQIMWIYASGFPKSHNLEGEWEGWGTALKPAHEPLCMARKPFNGTVAENVLAHGTGVINIDACRIAYEDTPDPASNPLYRKLNGYANANAADTGSASYSLKDGSGERNPNTLGRWPANLIHDGSEEVLAHFPESKGQQGAVTGEEPSSKTNNVYGQFNGRPATAPRMETATSAARFFYCAKASKADRDEGLDDLPLPERQA